VSGGRTSGGQGPQPAPEPHHRDPGAQPERTRLAWRRTTLTFAVAVGLGVRRLLYGDGTATALAAMAVAVLAWLAFLAVAHARISGMTAREPAGMTAGAVRAAALCTLAMVAAGLVMLW